MAQDRSGWHTLTQVDTVNKRAVCNVCGPVTIHYKKYRNQWRCGKRATEMNVQRLRRRAAERRASEPPRPPAKPRKPSVRKRDKAKYDYRAHKGDVCEWCGFTPEHPCQLDVDHIIPVSRGGTNDPSNLQTLCANCHRIKSHRERKSAGKAEVLPRPAVQLTVFDVSAERQLV